MLLFQLNNAKVIGTVLSWSGKVAFSPNNAMIVVGCIKWRQARLRSNVAFSPNNAPHYSVKNTDS